MEVTFASSGIDGLDEVIPGLPEGGLILLAGNPGTGKTLFSAGFIYHGIVDRGERGVYASLAESRGEFYANMKALGYDFEKLEREGIFSFLNLITLIGEGASTLINEILAEVEDLGAKRLVVDPFSAIAQGLGDPREVRVFLHTFLSKTVKKLGCTTILVEEIPFGRRTIGYGFEEFVADAVIILKSMRYEDKLLRELRIAKLRGAEVRNPDVCFTLHKGFKAFPPFRKPEPRKARRYEPIPDPSNAYSTGVKELDEAIGGYPKGSVVLLDLDARISTEQYRLIVAPTIANFIVKGRPVIVIPTAGAAWMDVADCMKGYGLSEGELKEHLRIPALRDAALEAPTPSYVIPYEPKNLKESYQDFLKLEGELLRRHDHPVLKFAGLDWLVHFWGEEGAIYILNLDARRTRYLGGLTILLGKPIYPEIAKRIPPLASVHLKLTRRHGCLLLYGVKPRTPLYAVEADYSKGYLLPKLTPIV
ncbi:MAG: AAA family ATPase [Thaumarchaeota archaeon]|nr:AAA family ATPase [Nitrososphaerota archaeon]